MNHNLVILVLVLQPAVYSNMSCRIFTRPSTTKNLRPKSCSKSVSENERLSVSDKLSGRVTGSEARMKVTNTTMISSKDHVSSIEKGRCTKIPQSLSVRLHSHPTTKKGRINGQIPSVRLDALALLSRSATIKLEGFAKMQEIKKQAVSIRV